VPTGVKQAYRDATCAVDAAGAIGIDPDALGAAVNVIALVALRSLGHGKGAVNEAGQCSGLTRMVVHPVA
jgi:hypothetical protein